MKKYFIIQLESHIQEEIKKEVKLYLKKELNLSEKEIEKEIEIAMSSRLIDLEEMIDIKKYIN